MTARGLLLHDSCMLSRAAEQQRAEAEEEAAAEERLRASAAEERLRASSESLARHVEGGLCPRAMETHLRDTRSLRFFVKEMANRGYDLKRSIPKSLSIDISDGDFHRALDYSFQEGMLLKILKLGNMDQSCRENRWPGVLRCCLPEIQFWIYKHLCLTYIKFESLQAGSSVSAYRCGMVTIL